jgi:hypothetical protein
MKTKTQQFEQLETILRQKESDQERDRRHTGWIISAFIIAGLAMSGTFWLIGRISL